MRYLLSILGGLLAAGGIYLVCLYFSLGKPAHNEGLMIQAWYDIKNEALDKASEPRIIVAGGSSGLFGVNAGQLAEATGWPCVNYATHAALGLPYHLHRALDAAEPGDVILGHWEICSFDDPKSLNPVSSPYFFEQDPDWIFEQDLNTQIKWLLSVELTSLRKRLKPGALEKAKQRQTDIYAAELSRLDDLGSMSGHTANTQTAKMRNHVVHQKHLLLRHPRGITRTLELSVPYFAEFLEKAAEKGVHVITLYPPILTQSDLTPQQRSNFEACLAIWEDFYREHNLNPVGNAARFAYDESAFYDTVKHLSEEGMTAHTRNIAEEIIPMLPERPTGSE